MQFLKLFLAPTEKCSHLASIAAQLSWRLRKYYIFKNSPQAVFVVQLAVSDDFGNLLSLSKWFRRCLQDPAEGEAS
jgi:hypothetical protein